MSCNALQQIVVQVQLGEAGQAGELVALQAFQGVVLEVEDAQGGQPLEGGVGKAGDPAEVETYELKSCQELVKLADLASD